MLWKQTVTIAQAIKGHSLASDAVTIGELNLSSWTHFAARYYTQTAANARYNLKNTAALAATGGWQQDGTTGLIMQMGIATRTNYSTRITFPKAFPNFCMGVHLTLNGHIGSLSDSTSNIRATYCDKTGFTYDSGGTAEQTSFYVAFGK